ncbi:MAG: endo-1,3-alpha-glucanase family glycosylhydrolase [Anaerolineales bacterium]|nr:endo-1,3-alpha-glucanase family glycosylhydrolase [Anaerolineales bacterium]
MRRFLLFLTLLTIILSGCGPSPTDDSPDRDASTEPSTDGEAGTSGLDFPEFFPGSLTAITRIVIQSGLGERRQAQAEEDIAGFIEKASGLILTPQSDQSPRGGFLYRLELYTGGEKALEIIFNDLSAAIDSVYYDLNFGVGSYLDDLFSRATELVSYHSLTFELTTTAQAARVTFSDPYYFLSAHFAGTLGEPAKGNGDIQSLWVGQESEGSQVGVLMEYAITWTGVVAPSVLCQYEQRGGGTSALRVWDSVSGEANILAELTFTATGECSLDISALNEQPFLEQALPERPARMLWAYYYPWYIREEWDTSILLDQPTLGYYGSGDRATIEQHIQQAQEAGIDGFISSWWGPHSYTDDNLRLLLDAAQARDFSVMINFELLMYDGQPLPEADILNWLRYAVSKYGDHPAYAEVDGRPVFVVWVSYLVPDPTWEQILTTLRDEGLEPFLIGQFAGESADLDSLEVFSGLYQYNILNVMQSTDADQLAALQSVYENIGRSVHYFPLLGPSTTYIWAATVQPGYDDHLIPRRTSPILPRDDGSLYRATFEAAIASNPDWIFITSWNEWWEHTYIEPSQSYNADYLDITREYSENWKNP